MNPIRSIIFPAAVAVLSLYGASGVMAAGAAPAAAVGEFGSIAAQAEVDTGMQLVRDGGGGRHGGGGGGGGGGGAMHHRGPGGGGGFIAPRSFSGNSGFSSPKHSFPKQYGGSSPSFRPYTSPKSYGFVHRGKHHNKHHFRHRRGGFYFYPYYSYYPYDYYDYSYSSSYNTCYWNCRQSHGPRYCRIYWRRYCY